ncbi:MAG: AAA family ATPase [Chloroflexi bacterium]|nr:AAA family ATPase [Chloroflexota bacterium]
MNQTIEFSNILRTKLYCPQVPESFVDRPHLLKQLNAGRHRPFTLVSAAAGYGKTTLISSWLDRSETANAWVSLNERDDDLVMFLTYFIAAVQTRFPTSCRETLALLEAATLPPLPVLSRALINDLDELEQAFILVLDDFHFIQNTDVHNLLNEILRHPPRPLHLVVITRRDPALPITTLLAQGKMTEIRTRDLRFSEAETKALLQQMQDVDCDQATAADLTDKAEGWVTGLRLAILTGQRQGDPSPLLSSQQENLTPHVADYLMEEVVTVQPPAIQDFLLRTSILDWLNGPLCDAVTGLDESEYDGLAYLDWLHKANLFILPLSGQQGYYRYHHLFRERLQTLLANKFSSNDISALHKHSSVWLSDNGLHEEAIHHALAAGDTKSAVELVIKHRHTLLLEEQFQILERLLDILSQDLVERDADLLLTQAWLLENRFRHAEIPPLLELAAALLRDDADLTNKERAILGGEIAGLWAILYYWMGQGQLSLENAEHAVDVTPIEHEWVHGEALTLRAGAYQLVGQLDRAYKEMHNIVTAGGRAGKFTHRAYGGLMAIEMLAGNLSGLEQAAQLQVNLTKPRKLYMSLGWARMALGHVLYQRNDLAKANQEFTQVAELHYLTHDTVVAHGYYGKALCLLAQGKSDLAQESSQAAIDWAMQTNNAYLLLEAESFSSRLALLEGEAPDINRWATPVGDEVPMMLMPHIPQLTIANVLLAQGTFEALDKAANLLTLLHQSAESTHNTWRLMEITAMQAILKEVQGEHAAALNLLQAVVDWAEPHGYIRLFADLGPEMARLLERLHRQSVASDYIAQILAAFPASDVRSTSLEVNLDLVDPLTNREMQTLKLLATEKSFDEIAAEMVVSVNTVRTHAKRIYSKLNVNSRMQAIHRANELGLL